MEIVKLGDLVNIKTGNMNKQDSADNGEYNFYTRSTKILKSVSYTFEGKGVVIPGEGIFIPMYVWGKFAVHQRVYYITSKSNKLENKYLFYWLTKNINLITKAATGSTVKSLRMNNFINPKINLISINVQHEIIDIIEPFEKIKNNYENKINVLLKIISSAKKNKNKIFYLNHCTELIKNKKHNIHQVSAKILSKQNPLIKDFEQKNTYKTNTFFCEKNTLVINTIRTYLRKFCIIPGECDVTGTMVHLNVIKKHTSILSNLLNDSFWEQTIKFSKGTKMPQISVDDLLKNIQLYNCDFEMEKMYDYITNINNIIIFINKIINNLIFLYIKD